MAFGGMQLKAAETVTLNIATLASGESSMVTTLNHWAAQMQSRTNGRVVIRILSDGVVGDESATLEALNGEKMDGAVLSAWSLATYNKDVLAACLPSNFETTANYFMYLQFFQDQLQESFSGKGLFLADLTLGTDSYLLSQKKLNNPEALKKEKFAVQNSLEAEYWGHFGMKTALSKPATFSADFQAGKFSACSMGPLLVKQLNMGDLPRSKQSFALIPWGVVIKSSAWEKISVADQRTLITGLESLLYGSTQKALEEHNQFLLPGFKSTSPIDLVGNDWKQFFDAGKAEVMEKMISEALRQRLAEMTWN